MTDLNALILTAACVASFATGVAATALVWVRYGVKVPKRGQVPPMRNPSILLDEHGFPVLPNEHGDYVQVLKRK